jgi:surface protein
VRKATLKPGSEINDIWRFTLNADPTSVERFTGTFTDALQNDAINIAISASDYPVYTWNSGSTIYYYTEADEVYLNSNSAGMFGKLRNLRSIDFNFGLESDVDPDGDGYVGFISGPVFITSNVTRMNSMFYYTGITTLDLSGMDTRNVTDMSWMFHGSSSLTTIYASNLFNTNAVTDSGMMFAGTTNLTGGNGTTYNSSHEDKEYARIDTQNAPGYFTLKTN